MRVSHPESGDMRRQRGHRGTSPNSAITVFTALAATWAAGFVDATGWMLLSHIYTSNMTGNSISMAVEWIEGKWINAAERAWPVLLFVCGLLLGAIITEFMVRRGKRSFSAVNFAVEFVAIGAFVLLARPLYNSGDLQASGWMFYLLVAMLALGMGVQNQTVTRLGALNIHTTHVTGTLTTFGADTAEFLFWLHDRSHTPKRFVIAVRLAWRQKEFREMVTTLSLWLFFSVGALAAVFATKAFGPSGLFAPMVILAALIVIDLTRPVMASAEAMKIAEARQPRS